jgi:hypothetical protein
MHDPNCLFCKITQGQIPSRKVYEDEEVFAFHDIRPSAPIHFLIVPKLHVPSMAQVTDEHAALLGRMMAAGAQAGAAGGLQPVSGRRLSHRGQHRHRRRAGSAPPAPARDGRAAALARG